MRQPTKEQLSICHQITNWFSDNDDQYLTIGGYAGTGKTYLISLISNYLRNAIPKIKIGFVAFTGKASSTLMNNLEMESSLKLGFDTCGTIHSLIYKPEGEWNKKEKRFVIKRWIRKSDEEIVNSYDLIIIDEASMVSAKIWNDLRQYSIPIIAVGDHGQLPPIGDNFNLMSKLDYKLSEIHRQAKGSGIIDLSSFIRKNGYIPNGKYSKSVFKVDWSSAICQKIWNNIDFLTDDVICICGFNKSRVQINNMIRKKLKYRNVIPYPTERLVCLKNNADKGVYNGQTGTLSWVMPSNKNKSKMTIVLDGTGEFYDGEVNLNCFGKADYSLMYEPVNYGKRKIYPTGDFFDFGYCISVHKSQGSEFTKVILFEERSGYWDNEYYKRWLFTGVTRAKNSLMVISGY